MHSLFIERRKIAAIAKLKKGVQKCLLLHKLHSTHIHNNSQQIVFFRLLLCDMNLIKNSKNHKTIANSTHNNNNPSCNPALVMEFVQKR